MSKKKKEITIYISFFHMLNEFLEEEISSSSKIVWKEEDNKRYISRGTRTRLKNLMTKKFVSTVLLIPYELDIAKELIELENVTPLFTRIVYGYNVELGEAKPKHKLDEVINLLETKGYNYFVPVSEHTPVVDVMIPKTKPIEDIKEELLRLYQDMLYNNMVFNYNVINTPTEIIGKFFLNDRYQFVIANDSMVHTSPDNSFSMFVGNLWELDITTGVDASIVIADDLTNYVGNGFAPFAEIVNSVKIFTEVDKAVIFGEINSYINKIRN